MRLRVLHVSPYSEMAWACGGIPRVVRAQSRELARRGHRVTVATTDVGDHQSRLTMAGQGPAGRVWPPQQLADNLELRVFPNLSNRLAFRRQLYLPRGLGRYLERAASGFLVAHLHGMHNLPGVIAARHLRRIGIPYLLQPHGTAPLIERRRLAKWIFDRTVGRRVLPGAARVLAVTEAERRQLLALGVQSQRIEVLANPLDLAELEPPPVRGSFRQAYRLGDQRLVIYMGQLSPRKQVHLLVAAFAQAAAANARLVIIGADQGELGRVRRAVERYRLQAEVLLTGVISGRQRLEALADADLVVYPGKDEIFGLVPLEALLCGTPVIVAGDCGCGELISRFGGGEVVPAGEVAALAAAIAQMLADSDGWRLRVEPAAARIQRELAPAKIADRLQALYELVADRREVRL